MIKITANERDIPITEEESKSIFQLLAARPGYVMTDAERRNRAFDAGFRIAMILSKASAPSSRVEILDFGNDCLMLPDVISVIEDLGPWEVTFSERRQAA